MVNLNDILPRDLGNPDPNAPVQILQSLADDLTTRYGGLIKGFVSNREVGDQLWSVFYLVAPALDNYKYRLFSITHKNIKNYYPVTIPDFWEEQERVVNNEHEFEEALKEIFHSEAYRNVESTLLSRSKNVPHF